MPSRPSRPSSEVSGALPDRPSFAGLAVAGVTLVGWNAALNLVPFPAWAYVPANLALAGAAVLAGRACGLGAEEMGLGSRQRRGLVIGLGVMVAVGAGLLAALRLDAAAPFLGDARAAGLAGWGLVYGAAIRIPFGTAVPEEVLFRGVLLGALHRRLPWWGAAAWSSVVFGLWHIGPSIVLARVNALDTSTGALAAVVGASVIATALAGLGFCLLRRWGGGVLAPVLAHAATNAFGLLAAAAAQRAA